MKKTKKLFLVFVISCLISIVACTNTKAHNVELDPKGLIGYPMFIFGGSGEFTIASSETGYTLYYQVVEISDTVYSEMKKTQSDGETEQKNIENTMKTIENECKDLKTILDTAYEKYKNATGEEKEQAKDAYNTAYTNYNNKVNEYNNKVNEYKTKSNEISAKLKELTPTYVESNWIKTTNNEFVIDSSKFSGKKTFALWAKLVSSDGTISYDVQEWTVSGTKEDTDTDTKTNENKTDNSENISENESYTDFSKAKIELVQNGPNGYNIQISNVGEINDNHQYKYYIGNESATPTYKEAKNLTYDKDKKMYIINYIEDYLELKDKYYLYIFEGTSYPDENGKIVLNKTEIEKVALKKYSDAYSDNSHITYSHTQLIYNMPFGTKTSRKMNVKIGKISDQQLLKDIKDNKADSLEKLLAYAKKSETIYNNILVSNERGAYTAEQSLLDINKLEDDAYYFVYTSFDGENDKYVESECVTFAQADVYINQNAYFLFLYGSKDFKWSEFSTGSTENKQDTDKTETKKDDTTATTKIPQTGQSFTIVAVIAILSVIGAAGYKFIRKNRDIK